MDIKQKLDQALKQDYFLSKFNTKKNQLRYINPQTNLGVTLELNELTAFFQTNEYAVEKIAHYIRENLLATDIAQITSQLDRLYPVIRSTSFPMKNKQNQAFITTAHTAETKVFYVIDQGKTYHLINESQLTSANMPIDQLQQIALANLEKLPFSEKKDSIAGNDFYFINRNDGYDASRILLTNYLTKRQTEIKGTMVIAIPHQDSLIIADIQNETGFDILAQMNMYYFTKGNIPITSLPFLYQNGELEAIFILAKNKTQKN